jgi:hypothetical protein
MRVFCRTYFSYTRASGKLGVLLGKDKEKCQYLRILLSRLAIGEQQQKHFAEPNGMLHNDYKDETCFCGIEQANI